MSCVLIGGPDNQVHFEGYQVSNQCMALVRDECLLPCKDTPELGYAKESSTEQYVPDVFYKVDSWHTSSCFSSELTAFVLYSMNCNRE